MKRTIQLFLLLFLMSVNGKAHITNDLFITNSFITPANPTETDSIFFVTNFIEPAYSIYHISSTSSNYNGIISVNSNLLIGSYGGATTGMDTYKRTSVFIGSLSPGDYELIYLLSNELVLGLYDPSGSPYFHTDTLSFTVQAATDFNQTITEQNIPLELNQGWNMVGYNCIEPMNAEEAFASISDKITILKDNLGNAYLPNLNYNGIGNLEFSQGYQIKLTEDIEDFFFCPTIIIVE